MDADPQLMPIVVAGPTASGKSALGLALAEALGGVVINADSMQVYAELHVLTARPDAAEEARVPHRLYGTMPVRTRCSAGAWRLLARTEIAAAQAAGRRPVLVGGTGMYIQALLRGIAEIPPIPEAARDEARALLARLGGEAFRARLGELDPRSAARIRPSDSQRLTRAYEIVLATGRPMAEFLARDPADGMAARVIRLDPSLETLDPRIARRCAAMLENGALAEVAGLLAGDLDPTLPALKAVGVTTLARHLKGEIDRTEATALFMRETRQYARRQRTWFRHQLDAELTLGAQLSESLDPQIVQFIRELR